MITIKNRQRNIKIDENQIKKIVQKILNFLHYNNFDVGIWFTTNRTITRYNKKYRKKNKPTDILSFPFHESASPGKQIEVQTEDDRNLGDLIISLEYVKRNAEQLAISFDKHLQALLVHGICHLVGYNHLADEDYEKMRHKELQILKKLQD